MNTAVLRNCHDRCDNAIDLSAVPRYSTTQGNLQANADYILHLPDGQERRGTLDDQGYAREEDVPPGPCRIELSDPDFSDSSSSQEEDSDSTQESDSNTTQQQS